MCVHQRWAGAGFRLEGRRRPPIPFCKLRRGREGGGVGHRGHSGTFLGTFRQLGLDVPSRTGRAGRVWRSARYILCVTKCTKSVTFDGPGRLSGSQAIGDNGGLLHPFDRLRTGSIFRRGRGRRRAGPGLGLYILVWTFWDILGHFVAGGLCLQDCVPPRCRILMHLAVSRSWPGSGLW